MSISADWTLFLQIANFLVLIFVLNAVLYKPIRKILADRQAKIRGLEEGISTAENEAVEAQNSFKEKMSGARAKGNEEKDKFKQAGEEEQKRIIGEVNEASQKELENVKAQVAKDVEQAKSKLQEEIKGYSAAIAEKILGRAVS
jgi:F-type H+-transporting ATPase subunit b